MKKPIQIEGSEWYFCGCFIQEQKHHSLFKYCIIKDTRQQETAGTAHTFTEAKAIARRNEVKAPYLGLDSFLG